jgi:hypothetical protein
MQPIDNKGYIRIKNNVQFQKSISLADFMALYGTEAQCRKVVFLADDPKSSAATAAVMAAIAVCFHVIFTQIPINCIEPN